MSQSVNVYIISLPNCHISNTPHVRQMCSGESRETERVEGTLHCVSEQRTPGPRTASVTHCEEGRRDAITTIVNITL